MAKVFKNIFITGRIAHPYYRLRLTTSKDQRTAASIAFISKCLHSETTPTFAKVKGQFKKRKDQWAAEKSLMIKFDGSL